MQTMNIVAWDQDLVSANDSLGEGEVPLNAHRKAFMDGEQVQCELPLEYQPKRGRPVDAGQVFLVLSWEPDKAIGAPVAMPPVPPSPKRSSVFSRRR